MYSQFAVNRGGVMASGVVSRPPESRAVSEFLRSADRAAVRARHRGRGRHRQNHAVAGRAGGRRGTADYRVFSARVGQAETVLAYAAVADLLGDVERRRSRRAARRAARRRRPRAAASQQRRPATDQGVVAAAFAAVIDRLSPRTPGAGRHRRCAVARPSSQAVVAFAARRFTGRVGLLHHRAVGARGRQRGEHGCSWPDPTASTGCVSAR